MLEFIAIVCFGKLGRARGWCRDYFCGRM